KEIGEVKTTLLGFNNRFIESVSEQKTQFATLDDAQKKLCSSAEDIGKFSTEFSKLVNENKQLREENKNLTNEKAELIGFLKAEHNTVEELKMQLNYNREREDDEQELGM
ncbi:MAG: hypothetical protein VB064_05920, partial [Oscillospiraceae bacterium]|nr:hypothetical protein [Oscillospiraceae bacterium]